MKRILEYKVFDLLKNKDNEKFLDKVKKENPEYYTKFLNILGNKGLDIAKEKYKDYDPEFVAAEKERKAKERTKKGKEELRSSLLELFKNEIEEIEKVLLDSPLKKVLKFIYSDERLSSVLKSRRIKKQYKNIFLEFIRGHFNRYGGLGWTEKTKIETLAFIETTYDEYEFEPQKRNVLRIEHHYKLKEHKSVYYLSIYMRTSDGRANEFIKYRNKKINMLSSDRISVDELLSNLKKMSYYLSDDFYKEWTIEQNATKYNI